MSTNPGSTTFAGAERLSTPQVVVDTVLLKANITRMAAIVPAQVEIHPHVKTHKSFAIAGMQRAAGAAGFTASRPPEAAAFLRAGLGPITVAFPVVRSGEAAALIRLAQEAGTSVRFIADSVKGVEAIERAISPGMRAQLWMKVDVGLHRCGVAPRSQAAVGLAQRIARSPQLTLTGLLSHAGNAYSAATPAAIRAVAAQERELMLTLREKLADLGVQAPRISVGSTPTMMANAGFDGIEEVRPGNYVFLDLTAVRLGIAQHSDLALAVVASVVSANDAFAIVDAGSKTMSSDLGPHGTRIGSDFGLAYEIGGDSLPFSIKQLSEEHGFLDLDGRRLAIGAKVLILPNHACTVVNLSSRLCFLQDGAPHFAPVDARSGDFLSGQDDVTAATSFGKDHPPRNLQPSGA